MKPLLEIDRSAEILNCLKDTKLNKKTILVVMPAQSENARKFFADENKNFANLRGKKNLQLLEFAFVANPANFVTRQSGGQVLEITRHLLN